MDTFEQGDAAILRDSERRRPTRGKLALRLTITAVLLLIVFGGLYAYEQFREHAIANFFATNKPPPLPVSAVTAEAASIPTYLVGIGSLSAVHQVTVAPEVGGRVTRILFTSGMEVHAGDPLVQLNDDPDRGDLANFRAQQKLAQGNLARASNLAARQFETQANVETYQAQVDQAGAAIAKTEAIIAQKLVRAPFAGTLGIRQVDLGQFVNAGLTMVTLTDLDSLYVNFTLPEGERAKLAVGQTVSVVLDAYPKREFRAALTTIEPQVSADTRTIKAQATLANKDHLLMPGMFVHIHVVLPDQPNVVTVPETAVAYTLYGDSVFVIVQDPNSPATAPIYRVKRTPITTGEHFDNKVAVLSGINPGDRVVATGQLKLIDGATVEPNAATLIKPATVPVH